MVTVYVLKGESGKRYFGITNDLPRCLAEHRLHHSKGSQIIGKFFVLHTETFPDHKAAREKYLKFGQGRKWLDSLDRQSEPA